MQGYVYPLHRDAVTTLVPVLRGLTGLTRMALGQFGNLPDDSAAALVPQLGAMPALRALALELCSGGQVGGLLEDTAAYMWTRMSTLTELRVCGRHRGWTLRALRRRLRSCALFVCLSLVAWACHIHAAQMGSCWRIPLPSCH